MSETQKLQIRWVNVIFLTFFHILGLQGLYYLLTFQIQSKTLIWSVVVSTISGLGMSAGAHRLWAHRCYKAKLPLRVFLAMAQCVAFHTSIYDWSRDHRVHHKYSETGADPYNIHRGFFFSHVGWLLQPKHPEVKRAGKNVDMGDLMADPVVAFQRKYYYYLAPIFAFVIPSVVPIFVWSESVYPSICVAGAFKFLVTLHSALGINSFAHRYGMRAYDRYCYGFSLAVVLWLGFSTIQPADNFILNILTYGECSHNFHHVFPWDYKGAELDRLSANLTTNFVELMAKIGWAYDLRTTPRNLIKMRKQKTGDGSTLKVF